jgi:hypothetical protein
MIGIRMRRTSALVVFWCSILLGGVAIIGTKQASNMSLGPISRSCLSPLLPFHRGAPLWTKLNINIHLSPPLFLCLSSLLYQFLGGRNPLVPCQATSLVGNSPADGFQVPLANFHQSQTAAPESYLCAE